LKLHRRAKGLSAQQLADATLPLGFPIPRNTITNLENGRKESVSVQVITILARALGVPPIALLFDSESMQCEVFPGQLGSGFQAREWFVGRIPRVGRQHLSPMSDLGLSAEFAYEREFKELDKVNRSTAALRNLSNAIGTLATVEEMIELQRGNESRIQAQNLTEGLGDTGTDDSERLKVESDRMFAEKRVVEDHVRKMIRALRDLDVELPPLGKFAYLSTGLGDTE
jgi:transcriptional regulator with XRE-family HTH domain